MIFDRDYSALKNVIVAYCDQIISWYLPKAGLQIVPKIKKSGWTSLPFLLSSLLSLELGSSIALAADIKNGEQLARRWCATCHLVAVDQSQANADVPSFSSIAERSDFKSETIATFLLDPHPKMPSFTLSRKEADDIAEYTASLAGKERKVEPPPLERKRSEL